MKKYKDLTLNEFLAWCDIRHRKSASSFDPCDDCPFLAFDGVSIGCSLSVPFGWSRKHFAEAGVDLDVMTLGELYQTCKNSHLCMVCRFRMDGALYCPLTWVITSRPETDKGMEEIVVDP